jgi:hypothetical protein
MATITLIVQIVFFLVLCLGVVAQLRRKYKWHDRFQIPVVVLNIFFILFVMIPTFRDVVISDFPNGLSQVPTQVTAIHGTLGLMAQLLAIYCLLAGLKILPRKIGVLRYFMWAAFVFWTATLLFGIGVYTIFYTDVLATVIPGGGDEIVAEHDADVAAPGTEAPISTEALTSTIAESPVGAEQAAGTLDEHAEEAIATEEPAETIETPPTSETVDEHAAESAATTEATTEATEEAGEADEHAAEVVEVTELAGQALTATWQLLQPVNEGPSPRYEHLMQYSPATNQLFVVGGRNGERIFDDTWALNLDTLSWQFLAPESKSPTAPVVFNAVMMVDDAGQNLYVAVGQGPGGQNKNDIWKLDLAQELWSNISESAGSPPAPRYGSAGGNIGGNLVLTHGFGAQRYDDTWRFDTTSSQWQNITPGGILPLGRCLFAATPSAGNLVIHGGCSTPDGPCYRDDAWILDSQANVWREILSDVKPVGRQHHTLASLEPDASQIILFGGQEASQAARADVWLLDLTSGSWQAIESSGGPAARYNHTAAWIPGRGMVVFGGRDNNGAFNDLWLLSVGTPAPDTAAPTATPAPDTAAPTATPAPIEPTPTPELISEHDGG